MAKSLLDILKENEISVHERGRRWVASCPFHEGDRNPSFTIYNDETYFCFGCRVWGDAVKFLVDYRGWPYSQAAEYVGKVYEPKVRSIVKVNKKSSIYNLLSNVTTVYHKFLLENSGAVAYLKSRGLTVKTIKDFKIGYTDGAVLNLDETSWPLAVASGVIRNDGQETLSHRITIPNIVDKDNVDYIVGRTVNNDRSKYLGIKTPKPIYGLADAWHSPILFLVEGQFDWLILKQWEFPAISVGGSNVTKFNLTILQERRVVIVPDNDKVGLTFAKNLSEKLPKSMILDYSSMNVKDIGEAGISGDEAKEAFMEIVKERVNWISSMSPQTLRKSFPSLSNIIPLPST